MGCLLKRIVLAGFVAAMIAASLSAQSLTVSYVEGTAEVHNGAGWQNVKIGDTITPEATVRLDDHSYLEMQVAGATIALSQKGTYELGRIAAVNRTDRETGVDRTLTSKMAALFSNPVQHDTTMGVRGDQASDSNGISWVTSDAQVYLDSGKEYIKRGRYKMAVEQLKKALASASETERPEVHYYLGYAYSLAGDARNALRQISGLQPADLTGGGADLVILKGKLLFDTNAYAQDIGWLTAPSALAATDAAHAQVYYLLLGLSYAGNGNTRKAKQNLEKVISSSEGSQLAKTAQKLIEHL